MGSCERREGSPAPARPARKRRRGHRHRTHGGAGLGQSLPSQGPLSHGRFRPLWEQDRDGGEAPRPVGLTGPLVGAVDADEAPGPSPCRRGHSWPVGVGGSPLRPGSPSVPQDVRPSLPGSDLPPVKGGGGDQGPGWSRRPSSLGDLRPWSPPTGRGLSSAFPGVPPSSGPRDPQHFLGAWEFQGFRTRGDKAFLQWGWAHTGPPRRGRRPSHL